MTKIETTIDDVLLRLTSYFGKFSNEIGEKILLKELYFVFTNIKKYIDHGVDEDNELDELEDRVRILEKETDLLKSSTVSLKELMDTIKEDLTLLQTEDSKINSEIDKLETEDDLVKELINEILSFANIELSDLDGNDGYISSTLDEYGELIEAKLGIRRDQLERVDMDKINDHLLTLKETDEAIKVNMTSNHQTEVSTIKEIDDRIEYQDITENIVELKEVDITLNNSIDSLKSESDKSLIDLKGENEGQREELTKREESIEELEKDSERGSKVAQIGKIPVGKEDGFIDNDWVFL